MVQLPLVLQLQQLATDNDTDVTELLRKALLVATKLGLQSFRDWVNQELHGYGTSDVPEYRHVNAELKVRNPVRGGLIPFLIEDRKIMEQLCIDVPVQESVGSLVDLLQNQRGDGSLWISLHPQLKATLMRMQDGFAPLEPVRIVGRNQFAAIVDAVRTTILDWSLQLEADGVMGEGMTFSAEEKQRAQNITIENFQGIIGDVSGSAVTQNLQMSVRKGDLPSLRGYLTEHGVGAEDIDDLERAINADPTPTSSASFGGEVSAWVGKMVSKAATGAWQIGIGTAGGFLSKALGAYYGL